MLRVIQRDADLLFGSGQPGSYSGPYAHGKAYRGNGGYSLQARDRARTRGEGGGVSRRSDGVGALLRDARARSAHSAAAAAPPRPHTGPPTLWASLSSTRAAGAAAQVSGAGNPGATVNVSIVGPKFLGFVINSLTSGAVFTSFNSTTTQARALDRCSAADSRARRTPRARRAAVGGERGRPPPFAYPCSHVWRGRGGLAPAAGSRR